MEFREFHDADRSAYNYTIRNGLFDKFCAHMDRTPGGFDPAKPGTLYLLKITLQDGTVLWKIGITNRKISRRMASMGIPRNVKCEVSCTVVFDSGLEARETEQKLLRRGRELGLQYTGDPILKNGNTELFLEPLIYVTSIYDDHDSDGHQSDG